ncbi:50S ribosomal protein L11 methyltransferase [Lacibacterium aquatile]|uniref:Ribosomal protein L11 methyltransferase n=1 Tax=Lacibacterium aquatile TaxID=1168082 RepID=A0ABW5DV48_9PROT
MGHSSGYKIELVVRQSQVNAFGEALDPLAVAIAAFEIVPGGEWRMEAYCVDEPDAEAVKDAIRVVADAFNIGMPAYHIAPLPPKDWLAENRQSFPPQGLGRYFIYGSHFEGKIPASRIGLLVDAATAFGSGEHETTRGCLQSIDMIGRRKKPKRTLDVGSGSGILAMAMAKSFRRPVIASDLDRESVRVARENTVLNRVNKLVRVEYGAGYRVPAIRAKRPYDLIVANILARPLCMLAKDLKAHLAPGGHAILSGLLNHQEAMVLAAHRAQGLRLVHKFQRKGWSALVLARTRD